MKIRGNTVGTPLRPGMGVVKATSLTKDEQAQARANIGVSTYYSTTREEIGVSHEDINKEYIWGLYDALMTEYPDRVQKNEIHNNDGTFTNYEYVVSTGDYNEVVGAFNAKDDDIKKPKYLVLSGIHGYEVPAILSTYRFIRDVLDGHNIPAHFREGCVIHCLPIANPYSLDSDIRFNANGVDINRNFDWKHGEGASAGKNPGTSPASEQETQAIAKWLDANKDAELFVDCHNMQGNNEIVTIVGLTDSEEYSKRKRIAMRGIDRAVPFWKDTIGYGNKTIFRNSASLSDGGLAIFYASEALNIPSIALEMSVFPTGTETSKVEMAPETIAVATEVIGNVLIEFYEQAFCSGVIDMTETNEKLDGLAESMEVLLNRTSFRMEKGVYTVANDLSGAQTVQVPCASGANLLVFMPDDATRDIITATGATRTPWFLGLVAQRLVQFPYQRANYFMYRSYMSMMKYNETDTSGAFVPSDHGAEANNVGGVDGNGNPYGFSFPCIGLKAGNYNWTAYYWNE